MIKYHGKTRPDMGGNCPERFDPQFMKYVATFRRTHRKEILVLLGEAKNVNVVTLKSRRQTRKFVNTL